MPLQTNTDKSVVLKQRGGGKKRGKGSVCLPWVEEGGGGGRGEGGDGRRKRGDELVLRGEESMSNSGGESGGRGAGGRGEG